MSCRSIAFIKVIYCVRGEIKIIFLVRKKIAQIIKIFDTTNKILMMNKIITNGFKNIP